jgi:hypothetical protein
MAADGNKQTVFWSHQCIRAEPEGCGTGTRFMARASAGEGRGDGAVRVSAAKAWLAVRRPRTLFIPRLLVRCGRSSPCKVMNITRMEQ